MYIMNFSIKRQETYSRGELLLRSFFGFFYIIIPHYIVMIFYTLGFLFSRIATFFTILFSGKFPVSHFNFQQNVLRYMQRLNCTFFNMTDGYPSFSLEHKNPNIVYDMDYREKVDLATLLIRTLFSGLMLFPHLFVLIFRIYGCLFISFIAWFAILFTGKFPEGMFKFMEGTFRWSARLSNYQYFYKEQYPPFTGQVIDGENQNSEGLSTNDHLIAD